MITKWGKRVLNSNYTPMNTTSYGVFPRGGSGSSIAAIEAKDAAGNIIYISPIPAGGTDNITTSNVVSTGLSSTTSIAIGDGDTPATENDYTIESQITGFNVGSPVTSVAYDDENDLIFYDNDYTITNNTGADITIKEVCTFKSFYYSTTRGGTPTISNNYKRSVMMERTVLDTPLVIPNGEARTLRIRVACDIS